MKASPEGTVPCTPFGTVAEKLAGDLFPQNQHAAELHADGILVQGMIKVDSMSAFCYLSSGTEMPPSPH